MTARLRRLAGTVGELHRLDPDVVFGRDADVVFAEGGEPAGAREGEARPGSTGGVEVWDLRPTDAAVVLGSAQREPVLVVDEAACARRGLTVVRRRSGGGVVLVEAASMVWIDVVIPAHDPRFVDDVARSMVDIGERFAAALARLGGTRFGDDLVVVPAGPRAQPSGICFAGVAPGEVLVRGRKLVGLSQRRTRRWARIQALAHVRLDADLLAAVVAPELAATARSLADRVAILPPAVAAGLPAAIAATF